jgi:hypothetical protein
LIVISLVFPLYQTGLPILLDSFINIASLLMFFIFPIFFWPKFIEISRSKCTLALLGGVIVWIVVIATLAPMIVEMPDL